MKHRAFALVLALCLVLAMVPAAVFAADVHQAPAPALSPAALPELEIRPLSATYQITMTSTGPGKAELYADKAGALESVYFLADPDPGYQVSFAKCGYYKEHYDMRLLYIGNNVYEIIMPDGDVILDLEFVAIPGSSHDVTLTVTEGGTAQVDQTNAKAGESLFVDATPLPGYSLESVRAKSDAGWLEGYYLGQNGDADRYEIFMPDADVEIFVTFRRNGPYDIETIIDSGMGTLEVSHESAYELDTVTVTSIPDRGYELLSIGGFHSQLTRINKTQWTFSMPKFKEEIHAAFGAIDYALSVSVEEPQGGIAFLDAEIGNIGQTVTLTCIPDDGYRIARITGAELTPGEIENTWTFVMDAGDVALSVLFLRENNPFLDVTELDFYHDPVLWAVENSITNGVDAEHFGPFTACNRAQVVTFLWRAAGSPEPASETNPFTDVAEGSFYHKAVLWAVEMGITNGLTETTFGPDEICNRAQVVTFLYRANGSPATETQENPFEDVPDDSFYRSAVLWALENGVTTGASDTAFNPGGQCLRAQVVTFLYRADQIPEPEPEPEPEPDPLPFPDLG